MFDILEKPVAPLPTVAETKVDDFIRAFNGKDVAKTTQYAQQLAREKQSVAFALDMISEQARRPRTAPVKALK